MQGVGFFADEVDRIGARPALTERVIALADGTEPRRCFLEGFLRFYEERLDAAAARDELADSLACTVVLGLGSSDG